MIAPPRRNAYEIAEQWYKESHIARSCETSRLIPRDVSSSEFASWLTEQYRLAMAKGIQFGRQGQ